MRNEGKTFSTSMAERPTRHVDHARQDRGEEITDRSARHAPTQCRETSTLLTRLGPLVCLFVSLFFIFYFLFFIYFLGKQLNSLFQ